MQNRECECVTIPIHTRVGECGFIVGLETDRGFVGCHVSIVRIHVSIPFQFDAVLVDDDLIGSGFGGQVLHPIKATSDFVIPKIDLDVVWLRLGLGDFRRTGTITWVTS